MTGASGFVGSHAAENLAAHGWAVRVLVRATSSRRWLQSFPHEIAIGDVRDESGLLEACRDCDAVVHAAGVTNVRRLSEYFDVNTAGTERLWQAARETGVGRFLYVSSLAAGGPSRDGVVRDETTPPAPVSTYGRSKLAGEEVVLDTGRVPGPAGVVVRPPAVYGPRDPDVLTLVRFARSGHFPMTLSGRREASMVYATDLADGMRLALEKGPAGGVYYLTDGAVHTLPEVAAAMGKALGRKVRAVPVPRLVLTAAALGGEVWNRLRPTPATLNLDRARQFGAREWTASDRRARSELGYRSQYDLERGLAETIAWYRHIGWI